MEDNTFSLSVPKNRQGYIDYDYGIFSSDNVYFFVFNLEEFSRLYDTGLLTALEAKFPRLYLSEGESNMLSSEELRSVYHFYTEAGGLILDAVDKAIECDTCLFMNF